MPPADPDLFSLYWPDQELAEVAEREASDGALDERIWEREAAEPPARPPGTPTPGRPGAAVTEASTFAAGPARRGTGGPARRGDLRTLARHSGVQFAGFVANALFSLVLLVV